MIRFFCKTSAQEVDNLQVVINEIIGNNLTINLKGNGRTSTGKLPYEYYFSSGLIEDNDFYSIQSYIKTNLPIDNVFIEWDGEDINDLSSYYIGLKDLDI